MPKPWICLLVAVILVAGCGSKETAGPSMFEASFTYNGHGYTVTHVRGSHIVVTTPHSDQDELRLVTNLIAPLWGDKTIVTDFVDINVPFILPLDGRINTTLVQSIYSVPQYSMQDAIKAMIAYRAFFGDVQLDLEPFKLPKV